MQTIIFILMMHAPNNATPAGHTPVGAFEKREQCEAFAAIDLQDDRQKSLPGSTYECQAVSYYDSKAMSRK